MSLNCFLHFLSHSIQQLGFLWQFILDAQLKLIPRFSTHILCQILYRQGAEDCRPLFEVEKT